ncbi:MAG: SET domain-containing protein-lysine N-methyltransferase [Burkholderiaceae bacterium]
MSPEKKDAFILISEHEHCVVKKNVNNEQHGLFANASFKVGENIVAFNASKIVDTPNYLTVQVSEHKHIHLFPEYLQYVNHCCEPNVIFNTTTMQLECVSDIEAGDELRFFYPSTEWSMAQQFVCNCGKPNCVGLVQGAADTSSEVLNKYKLTDFIKSMTARYKTFLLLF